MASSVLTVFIERQRELTDRWHLNGLSAAPQRQARGIEKLIVSSEPAAQLCALTEIVGGNYLTLGLPTIGLPARWLRSALQCATAIVKSFHSTHCVNVHNRKYKPNSPSPSACRRRQVRRCGDEAPPLLLPGQRSTAACALALGAALSGRWRPSSRRSTAARGCVTLNCTEGPSRSPMPVKSSQMCICHIDDEWPITVTQPTSNRGERPLGERAKWSDLAPSDSQLQRTASDDRCRL